MVQCLSRDLRVVSLVLAHSSFNRGSTLSLILYCIYMVHRCLVLGITESFNPTVIQTYICLPSFSVHGFVCLKFYVL